MKLKINEEYRIISNDYSWVVQKRKWVSKKTGETVWKTLTCHATVSGCLKALGDRMIRDSDAGTFAEAIAEVHRVTVELSKAFEVTKNL